MDGVKNKLPQLDPQSLEEEQPPQPKLPPKEEEVFNKVVATGQSPTVKVEEVVEQQEPVTEVVEQVVKKEKKKRVASDKLKEHLAKARAKSLETRRRNKALKQQKLAEANQQIQSEKKKNKTVKVVEEPTTLHREEQKPPIKQTTPFNYEIDYDKIINGVSNRLMKNFEIEEEQPQQPQYIQKPEPPQQNYHKPIKTEQQIRQEERDAAKTYYEQQAANRIRKDIAYNTIQRGGRMPKLNSNNVDADIWERCFRR